MTFTRRPRHRVYLCARLFIFMSEHFTSASFGSSTQTSSVGSFTCASTVGSFTLLDPCWFRTNKHLAHPAGVYRCYLHKLFQQRSNYFDKFLCWLVLFFIHRLCDHSTHLCAIFVATQAQSPERSFMCFHLFGCLRDDMFDSVAPRVVTCSGAPSMTYWTRPP